jgi:hypothetical protein
MTIVKYAVLLVAASVAIWPVQANAQDAGTVEQPDNVTTAPSDEGASERAGAGFDTPWTPQPYNDGAADNLEPKPFSATPNDAGSSDTGQ